MSEKANISNISNQLKGFKQKFYLNQLVKGLLVGLAILITLFLSLTFTEYTFQLNSPGRLFLLILFILICSYIIVKLILFPLYKLLLSKKQLSDEEAAVIIGKYYNKIDDKLLNIIQLQSFSADNSLAKASINQTASLIEKFKFTESISIQKESRKIFPFFILAIIILLIVGIKSPNLIKDGSYRIMRYQESFVSPAPFTFKLLNEELDGYKGDNFNIRLKIDGNSLPEKVYISKQGTKFLMDKVDRNIYQYTLNQVQTNTTFQFDASGYQSSLYELAVSDRPFVKNMLIEADYPAYTNIKDEKFFNARSLNVPIGTKLKWVLNTQSAEEILMHIKQDTISSKVSLDGKNNLYYYSKQVYNDFEYLFNIKNQAEKEEKGSSQHLNIIQDSNPKISLNPIIDSTYFSTIIIEGEINDDYGFSRLTLFYSTSDNPNRKGQFKAINIPVNNSLVSQKYFLDWSIDSLLQNEGKQITYFTKVWDNDQIKGNKSTQSQTFRIKYPNNESINKSINKLSKDTDNQFVESISSAKDLEDKLKQLDEILKTKQSLNFDDKQLLEEIMKQSDELNEKLDRIQEQLTENAEKRNKFSEASEELKEKNEALLERVAELQSDQKQELLEKIKDLLSKTNRSDELKESASELKKNETNKLKELERLMQLFKRLEVEYQMSEMNSELKKLKDKQEQLSKDSSSNQAIAKDQEELNKQFEEIKEKLKEAKEKNQQLEQPIAIKNTREIENEIDQAQQKSLEKLNKQERSESQKSQKDASKKMEEMSEAMQKMQAGMQGEQIKENIDNLRDVVDNLLKLSFRQEALMTSLRGISPSDPRFLGLSERQLNLKDDAKIIEDSLTAIAKRVFQIEAVITKEMNALKEGIDETISALKVREDNKAVGYQQQSMEHTNNLALLLDDIIQQMQMQMQSQGGQSSSNEGKPSPSDIQKSINQKTQELSEGQKTGRELSEGLAEIAAQQGRLRKMTEEMQKNSEDGTKKGGNGLGEILDEMESIEEELVNKRLNNNLINRQKKLVTKLLEAENAKNEQEEDNERTAETAKNYSNKRAPKAIEEYLSQRKKEIEQLNTAPPSLSPYYKAALNSYYRRINKESKNK